VYGQYAKSSHFGQYETMLEHANSGGILQVNEHHELQEKEINKQDAGMQETQETHAETLERLEDTETHTEEHTETEQNKHWYDKFMNFWATEEYILVDMKPNEPERSQEHSPEHSQEHLPQHLPRHLPGYLPGHSEHALKHSAIPHISSKPNKKNNKQTKKQKNIETQAGMFSDFCYMHDCM